MPISKTRKSIQAVGVEVSPFLKVSETFAPPAEFKVVGYLPVFRLNGMNEEYYTVEGGRVVAITARTETRWVNRLTIANGADAQTYTYAAADVNVTEDIDNEGEYVASAGASTATETANFPVGIAPYPYYSGILDERYQNYELQPYVAVWNQGYFEYPMLRTEQESTLVRGGLVRPGDGSAGDAGHLVRWVNGTDTVDQVCGRVWKIETISARRDRGLSKVHTVKGLSLSGTGTSGTPAYLVTEAKEAGGDPTLQFRVVINVGL